MANDGKRIKHLLLMLTGPEAVPTDWEQKFVESIEKQFTRSMSLSDAQYDKLEEVYEQVQER